MFTEYGKIIVRRTDGDRGAGSACIMVEDFCHRDRSVKCMTPREAFERQFAVLKSFYESDEAIIASSAVSKVGLAPKRNLIELRAKVAEILESNHVKSVEVGFEYEAGAVRYYSVITRHGNVLHKYRVTVRDDFENAERYATAKCNCAAKFVCRHIQRVAEVDAGRNGRDLYPVELANYNAYRHCERAA